MNKGTGKVYLAGAGPGDEKLVTVKTVECLKTADVVIYDRLVNKNLLDYAPKSAEIVFVGKESGFHSLPQDQINKLIVRKAKEGKNVVRLKGGDPFLFGRGGEEAEELVKESIPFEVIPGVTSALAVPAYAGIPITHRNIVSSVHIITGHKKHENNASIQDFRLLAQLEGTLVFLMGLSNLGLICRELVANGVPASRPVAVVSCGTTANQHKVIGTVGDIVEQVKHAQLIPPAVVIVGEVVSLNHRLDWFNTLKEIKAESTED